MSTAQLTITFSNDAWEFMYESLASFTEKNMTVNLTMLGETEAKEVDLVRIEGELYGTGGDPANAVLYVLDYLDAASRPSRYEAWGEERPIPMFADNGECTIVKVHVP